MEKNCGEPRLVARRRDDFIPSGDSRLLIEAGARLVSQPSAADACADDSGNMGLDAGNSEPAARTFGLYLAERTKRRYASSIEFGRKTWPRRLKRQTDDLLPNLGS
jgi:hypothetical protein